MNSGPKGVHTIHATNKVRTWCVCSRRSHVSIVFGLQLGSDMNQK